ncbi:Methyltransferase OMS1 [Yarrowia sp. C11]|nr:Methyltransferase OMS1 [Yarrowia sp. E02]KAG5369504.1 Methyltransferase OMS1 [Yarrowia sp. C11]
MIPRLVRLRPVLSQVPVSRAFHVTATRLHDPYGLDTAKQPQGGKRRKEMSVEEITAAKKAREAALLKNVRPKAEQERQQANDEAEEKNKRLKKLATFSVLFTAAIAYTWLVATKLPEIQKRGEAKREQHKGRTDYDRTEAVAASRDTTECYDALAKVYDDKMKWEERWGLIFRWRHKVAKELEGDVLEMSCGTGRNIDYLDTRKVKSITFVDSSLPMLEVAEEKFRKAYPRFKRVQFVQGKAESCYELAKDSGMKYDVVFETFGLCSHEDPVKAITEMKQLLKPGGKVVLLEHGKSSWEFITRYLDKKADERAKTWGCRWNLDIPQIVRDSGMAVVKNKTGGFGTNHLYILEVPEETETVETKPETEAKVETK